MSGISKSQVPKQCMEIDERVPAFLVVSTPFYSASCSIPVRIARHEALALFRLLGGITRACAINRMSRCWIGGRCWLQLLPLRLGQFPPRCPGLQPSQDRLCVISSPGYPSRVPPHPCHHHVMRSVRRVRQERHTAALAARSLAMEWPSLGLDPRELEMVTSARWRLPIGDCTANVFRAREDASP